MHKRSNQGFFSHLTRIYQSTYSPKQIKYVPFIAILFLLEGWLFFQVCFFHAHLEKYNWNTKSLEITKPWDLAESSVGHVAFLPIKTQQKQTRYRGITAALLDCSTPNVPCIDVGNISGPEKWVKSWGFLTLKKTSLHLGMVGFWPFKVWPVISWFRMCQVCGLFQSWFVVVLGCSKGCFFRGGGWLEVLWFRIYSEMCFDTSKWTLFCGCLWRSFVLQNLFRKKCCNLHCQDIAFIAVIATV